MRASDRDGQLAHLVYVLRSVAQVISWAVLIVLGVSMMVALGLALVHVMNFWASPGAP